LLAGIGGLVFFTPARARIITLYIVGAYSAFAIIFGTNDSYVYLLPAFVVFALWIGLAAGGILRLAPRMGWGVSAILLLSFLAMAVLHFPQVDASSDKRAETFGAQVMRESPPDAILFARGDRAVFALWYFHHSPCTSQTWPLAAETCCTLTGTRRPYARYALRIQGRCWAETILLRERSAPGMLC
jgi:hypothetical protein